MKDKLVEQQAHSILELKASSDKLDQQVIELELKLEKQLKQLKLLKQLYGRKSERSFHNASQLLLDLGEDATVEVVDALEEALREAEQVVADAEEKHQPRRARRHRQSDQKFPEHLPRVEKIIDIPEEQREGLKFIGYDEVENARTPWTMADEKTSLLLKKLQEAEQQQDFYTGLYRQYTTNLLKLVIYVRSLMNNADVKSHLQSHHADLMRIFEEILASTEG